MLGGDINILELEIILVSRVVLFLAVGSGLLVIRPHHLHENNHNYNENRTNQHEENQDDLAWKQSHMVLALR